MSSTSWGALAAAVARGASMTIEPDPEAWITTTSNDPRALMLTQVNRDYRHRWGDPWEHTDDGWIVSFRVVVENEHMNFELRGDTSKPVVMSTMQAVLDTLDALVDVHIDQYYDAFLSRIMLTTNLVQI